MQNILKLTGVSVLAIVTATNANAAGYTCEELIEYTSCNDGYVLFGGKCEQMPTSCDAGYYHSICPDGYEFSTNWCSESSYTYWYADSEEDCYNDNGDTFGARCLKDESTDFMSDFSEASFTVTDITQCKVCPAGASCAGGTLAQSVKVVCTPGKYQPNTGQTSCISAPVGYYAFGNGSTASVKCPTTGLTDENNNSVVATTVGAGASSVSQCIIPDTVYFTDQIGRYHYKTSCSHDTRTPYDEACELNRIAREEYCNTEYKDMPDEYASCMETIGSNGCGCDNYDESFFYDENTGAYGCEKQW